MRTTKTNKKIALTILLVISLVIIIDNVNAADPAGSCVGSGRYYSGSSCWVKDANDCPTQVNSIDCIGSVVCGLTTFPTGAPYCEPPASITLPSSWSPADQVNSWPGNPGYILDCYRNLTTPAPRCKPWVCQQNTTCLNFPIYRLTNCTGAYTTQCNGPCITNRYDCTTQTYGDLNPATCDVLATDQNNNLCHNNFNNFVNSGCACQCDTNYVSCANNVGGMNSTDDANGCETTGIANNCIGFGAGGNNYLTQGCVCTCDNTYASCTGNDNPSTPYDANGCENLTGTSTNCIGNDVSDNNYLIANSCNCQCDSEFASCGSSGANSKFDADGCEDTINTITSPCEKPAYGSANASWHTVYTDIACACGCQTSPLIYLDYNNATNGGDSYDGCEIYVGEPCTSDASIPGVCANTLNGRPLGNGVTAAGKRCNCTETTPEYFRTSVKAQYNSPIPLLWGQQNGTGPLMSLGNKSGTMFNITNGACLQFRDGTLQCSSGSGSGTALWTENGDNIYSTKIGNVGIGTTNPLTKLYVNGTTTIIGNLNVTGASYFGAQSFTNIDTSGNLLVGGDVLFVNSTSKQVGIGTTNPVTKLTIGSMTDTTSQMTLQGEYKNGAPFNNSNIFNFRHGGFDRIRLTTIQKTVASNDFDLKIQAINSSVDGYNDLLTIKGINGNVGIGTTDPTALLHLNTANGTGLALNLQSGHSNSVSTTAINFMRRDGLVVWQIGSNQAVGTGFEINTGNGINNRFYIDTSGKVGIGTSNPATMFQVGAITDGSAVIDNAQTAMFRGGFSLFGANRTQYPYSALFTIDSADLFIYSNQYYDGTNKLYDPNRAPALIQMVSNNADSYIKFGTKNANSAVPNEAMRIDKNGNVGIGTASPSTKLDVNGSIAQEYPGATLTLRNGEEAIGSGALILTSNTSYMNLQSAGNFLITQNSVTPFVSEKIGAVANTLYLKQGNVGIGTNNPSGINSNPNIKLVINGSKNVGEFENRSMLAVIDFNQAVGSGGNIAFGAQSSSSGAISLGAMIGMERMNASDWMYPADMVFYTHPQSSDLYERMRISANGYVSIGTNISREKLEIGGNFPRLRLDYHSNNYPDSYYALLSHEGAGDSDYGKRGLLIQSAGASGGGSINFRTSTIANGSDMATVMTVRDNGKVGIGTTNPGNLLQVNSGAAPSVSQFRVTANGAGSISALTYATDNSALTFDADYNSSTWIARSTSAFRIQKGTGMIYLSGDTGLTVGNSYSPSAAKMVMNLSNGNIGIGTSVPSASLHVENPGANDTQVIISTDQNSNMSSLWLSHDSAQQGGLKLFSDKSNNVSGITVGNNPYFPFVINMRNAGGIIERFRIDKDGNVGIGTTNPTSILHIISSNPIIRLERNNVGHVYLDFKNPGNSDNDDIGKITFYQNDSTNVETAFAWINGGSVNATNGAESGVITFGNMVGGSQTDVAVIKEGKVGIGTSSPDKDLVIANTVGADVPQIKMTGASGKNLAVLGDGTGSVTPNGLLELYNDNVSAVRLFAVGTLPSYINAGNVGIGTTNPTQKLTVVGDLNVTGQAFIGTQTFTNIEADGDLTVGKNANVTGNITATYFIGDGSKLTRIGAKFVGKTSSSYNGLITGGGKAGYEATNYLCNSNYTGSHLCTQDELINTIYILNITQLPWTGTAWVNAGGAKYAPATTPVDDCAGWSSSSSYALGNFWIFNNATGGGMGAATPCDQTKPLACCK